MRSRRRWRALGAAALGLLALLLAPQALAPSVVGLASGPEAVLGYHVWMVECGGPCGAPPSAFGDPSYRLFLVRADGSATYAEWGPWLPWYRPTRLDWGVDVEDRTALELPFRSGGGDAARLFGEESGTARIASVREGEIPDDQLAALREALDKSWVEPPTPTRDADCVDCMGPGFYVRFRQDGSHEVLRGQRYAVDDPAGDTAFRDVMEAFQRAEGALLHGS